MGWVVARDVGPVDPPRAPAYYVGEVASAWRVGWDAGHCAARAAMLGGKA